MYTRMIRSLSLSLYIYIYIHIHIVMIKPCYSVQLYCTIIWYSINLRSRAPSRTSGGRRRGRSRGWSAGSWRSGPLLLSLYYYDYIIIIIVMITMISIINRIIIVGTIVFSLVLAVLLLVLVLLVLLPWRSGPRPSSARVSPRRCWWRYKVTLNLWNKLLGKYNPE